MREVLEPLIAWWAQGRPVAMATVVGTVRSAPRPPGATMLVGPGGEAVGSVSGGCVEGAVYELAGEVLTDGRPRLRRYGMSDDDAFATGLTCGGTLEVFVQRLDPTTFPELGVVAEAISAERPVAVATVVTGPAPLLGRRVVIWPDRSVAGASGSGRLLAGASGSGRLDEALLVDAREMLHAGRTGMLRYGADDRRPGEGVDVFVESFVPPPRLIVFGASDFASAVARIGSFLGYRVTVCDARPVFATASRLPAANEVVIEWPHRYLAAEAEAGRIDRRTAICVLTHDPRFDVPVLQVALRLPEFGYLGAMGSRRTHAARRQRLREAGFTEAELARMSSPTGLDLGARTPQETAVSIAAEMIALHRGGPGGRLAARDGPIHGGTVSAPEEPARGSRRSRG